MLIAWGQRHHPELVDKLATMTIGIGNSSLGFYAVSPADKIVMISATQAAAQFRSSSDNPFRNRFQVVLTVAFVGWL